MPSVPQYGVHRDVANSRVAINYAGTRRLSVNASGFSVNGTTTSSGALTITTGGLTVSAGGITATGDNALGGAAVTGARNTLLYAAAGTVVTAVGVGLHIPAVTYTDAGATGTIGELATVRVNASTVVATNSITYSDAATLIVADPVASTGATFTRKYGIWSKGQIRTSTNIQVLNTAAFGTTQPVGAVVLSATGATAPAGTLASGGALFTDGTTVKKIIADGTVSDVQT